ncbi:MAG: amino acid ABC transporter permease [Mediterranea sp.]|jgi:hypothetical protein|nr:amino acid ABC transporter permease [Mediterranea sp.]
MKHLIQNLFLIALLPFVWTACETTSSYPHGLVIADSLSYTNPDSAVALLQQLKPQTSHYNKNTQMYYRLLCIKANDKAYITHTSDSLILPLLHYYKTLNEPKRLAEAYYYAGRVYSDLGDSPRAINYFYKAEEEAQQSYNELLSHIYSQLGTQFFYQDLYDEAMNMHKQAYQYSLNHNDSTGMILDLNSIAVTFSYMQPIDSAFYYNQQAFEMAKKLNNTKLLGLLSAQRASFYKKIEQYDLAMDNIHFSMENLYTPSKSATYSIAAKLYHQANRIDSATYYYNQLLECGTIYAKQASHRGLAEIAISRNKPEEAVTHLTKYLQCNDSVQKLASAEAAQKLSHLYNYQIWEKENSRLKLEHTRLRLWLLIAGVTFIGVVIGVLFYKERLIRKQAQMKLQQERLEQLNQELLKESIDTKERSKDKIASLEMEIAEIKGMQYEKRKGKERSFFTSEFYNELLNDKEKQLTKKQWQQLQETVNNIYPNFTRRLLKLYPFKVRELQVCMLIKIKLPATRIMELCNYSKQAHSSIRSRMYYKAMGMKGTPKQWDDFINTL